MVCFVLKNKWRKRKLFSVTGVTSLKEYKTDKIRESQETHEKDKMSKRGKMMFG